MVTRRRVVAGSIGGLLLSSLTGSQAVGAAESADEALVALPGKRPLIKRTFRPPNYETPLADLRSQITANDAFFVRYHLAAIPEIDPRTWRLRVGGPSVQRQLELSLADLKRDFERVRFAAINQCSGNRRGLFTPRAGGVQWTYGAMGNAMWGGVRLRDVLNRAGVKGDALEVVLDGGDGAALPGTPDFVKSLPVDRALDAHTLIAFEMNGQPLPHWNGAPARLVVAGWTATYWVKHLASINVEPTAFDGFWMKSAYRIPTGAFPGARFAGQENAQTTPITEILINSLVTSHVDGARLERGRAAELAGWAWDGGSGISAVEVSLDDGGSWRPATLGEASSPYAWRGFRMPLDTAKAGPQRISVRATGRNGARQPEKLTPNPSGYHHNIIQTLTLEVA
ncbi:MAG TPA: molybdopterin-dependent oxidoreductase [Steroidobacteraceae bacterium]|nr:molybdopterin-dependent oxidoreductase [Steroidobacteraceae bacterium]